MRRLFFAALVSALPAPLLLAVAALAQSPSPSMAGPAAFVASYSVLVVANLVFAIPFAKLARERRWRGPLVFSVAGAVVAALLSALPHVIFLRPDLGLLPYVRGLVVMAPFGAVTGGLFWFFGVRGSEKI